MCLKAAKINVTNNEIRNRKKIYGWRNLYICVAQEFQNIFVCIQ